MWTDPVPKGLHFLCIYGTVLRELLLVKKCMITPD